jgi:hypothetical protein
MATATTEHTTKKIAIKGTSFSLIVEILLIPPRITNATIIVSKMPVAIVGMFIVLCNASAIEFDCVAFPVPRQATIANIANSAASTFPNHLLLTPFLI